MRLPPLTDHDIDVSAIKRAILDDGFGAILVFEGTARDNFAGRRVLRLSYEAYPELAGPVFAAIIAESQTKWPTTKTLLQHRVGRVPFSEPTVVIATGAPHREECYEANRWVLEQLKAKAPIWKKEEYEDGHAWKANATT